MTRDVDILLVQCPMMCHFWPSPAIGYLCEYLRANGFKPAAMDLNIETFHRAVDRSIFRADRDFEWFDPKSFEAIRRVYDSLIEQQCRRIIQSGAPVVGFSVSGTNSHWTREVATRLRRLAPDRVIIFGGCDFIDLGMVIDWGLLADAFVIGEGEETLLEIMQRLRTTRDLQGIVGMVIPYGEGQLTAFTPRPLAGGLDQFPFPTLAEADLRRYLFPNVPISSSRGCVRQCTFCADSPRWKRYRSRSVEHVIEEMDYHRRLGLSETFYFTASLLNADLKWLDRLCEELIRRRHRWDLVCEMCIDPRMDARLFGKLARAGMRKIEYGLESGSDHVLELMNKRITAADASRVLAETHAAGIASEINLIAGFPGETEEDHAEGMRFLRANARNIDVVKAARPCAVLHNSRLGGEPERFGIENAKSGNAWRIGDTNTPEIRQRRTNELIQLARELGIRLDFEHQPISLKTYLSPKFAARTLGRPMHNLCKARRIVRWELGNRLSRAE